MMIILILLAISTIVSSSLAVYFYLHNKKVLKVFDEMADDILSGRKIKQSDLSESDISVHTNRMIRIQEKLNFEIGRAELEKEQVKQLIGNMAHQLKTPLANVIMYQEILENESTSSEDKSVFLHRMRTQSQKIDWILQSLFKMIRLEQNAIQINAKPEEIKSTIKDAVSNIYPKAEKKDIEISMSDAPDCLLLHDKKWTREVFENILENAIKYTENGGKINISIEPLEIYTIIHIKDNGRGIKADELIKIFERFYRSKDVENIEGSGIGLYLSKIILEKEKGYMTVKSEYGKGSCFSVFLQNCKN